MNVTRQDVFELARDQAKQWFDIQGTHLPVFMFPDMDSEKLCILPASFENEADQAAKVVALKLVLHLKKIPCVVLTFECWYARGSPDELKSGEWSGVMPSDRPDREEAVFIVGEERGAETIAGFWSINRDNPAKPFLETFKMVPGYAMPIGIMSNLLGQQPTKRQMN